MADEPAEETAMLAPGKPLPEPTEPEAAVVPEAVASEAVASETVADTAPKKKRTIRTRSLFAGALALGFLGGVAGGYTVQALRKPTPLPPLSVAQPVYPRSPLYVGTRPSALPANVDDATNTDGDLAALLLPTPSGAKATLDDHRYMSLIDEAGTCDNSAGCFSTNVIDGVARIADTAWNLSDGTYVEIRIFQYQPGNSNWPAVDLTTFSGRNKLTLPTGIAAAGYEYVDNHDENDDHAIAIHGDLAVYFWVTSTTRVPDPAIINDLITRQMARL
ncbi:MAG TPA: hypothetical protein VGS97_25250 [Actinocrinis sp.]|uniref:hypothetical protein n=1 Tax=Actinocrinis sp. TaxID=1920516 RepID=UPI002DDCA64F|nr:hypothetical protein [Actinocrinis sp.]HEV2347427.1 hypothetical protein [Actinocrinis sp.]